MVTSDVHVANARCLSEVLGAATRFYRYNLLDTPADLEPAARGMASRGTSKRISL
ncbi:MAG: hypothetical protein M3511_11615 [Deinococcota bacterium]|nr:hypothetical protein [Deinococcota bacterium]